MNRRTLLASLGGLSAGGVACLAGCLAAPGETGPAGGTDDRATDTATGDTSGPTDRTPRETPRPDAPFPPGRDDVDRVVWRRDVSDPDAALALETSAASVALPDAELSFTLENATDREFMTNFYDWTVYRWERGRWHHVAPLVVPRPLMSLDPGESHTWSVRLRSDTAEGAWFRTEGTADVTVEPVGGGHYAFAVDGWWRDQETTPAHEHQRVCAVRFDLAGDPLPLVPSNAVTDSRREGDTVVVTAENPQTRFFDNPGEEATYVLERTGGASDPRAFITEQVYRSRRWPLRDALAFADEGVETVRVETTTYAHPAFGLSDDDPPVRYGGRTYERRAERPDHTETGTR